MKKLLRRIFVFALIALPFVISTVGNVTLGQENQENNFEIFE